MTTKNQWKETEEDINNVEAWVELVEDMLYSVPCDLRAEVLARASTKEAAAREKREKEKGGPLLIRSHDFTIDFENTPGMRHWHTIMRLKSLLVQVFVRDIMNNHSPENAGHILFAHHRYGNGSGDLIDYLRNLPSQYLKNALKT